MPWIAEHQGTPVTPEDVSTRDTLSCPKCGDEMHIRGPYTRSDGTFVARHFSHNPDGSTPQSSTVARDCGGETDEHKRMKSVAYSKVKHVFGNLVDEIEFEMSVEGSGNIADVGVTFTDDVDTHDAVVAADCISGAVGDRLAIEVQYRNESKDMQGTAGTYAEHGYSVLWLYPEQFSKYDVELFTGGGAVWTPVYPEITRSDISFPENWTHHDSLIPEADAAVEVEATIPVDWYATELKRHLASTSPGPQYERWTQLFPDLADDYLDLVEEMLTDPEAKAQLLLDTLFPTMDPSVMDSYFDRGKMAKSEAVCGNCFYSQPDEYESSDQALVCWRNQPDGPGNQPRKVTRTDEFAQDCPDFSYDEYINEEMAEAMDLHGRLHYASALKPLVGARGASKRDQRKAALKFAYYQTWGMEDWNDFNFSPAREEAFLRHLDSELAVAHDDGCATKSETVYSPREVESDDQVGLGELTRDE